MRVKYPYSTLNSWGSIWENNENNWIFHHFYTKKKLLKTLKRLKKSPNLHKTADISVQAKVFSVWLLKDVTPYRNIYVSIHIEIHRYKYYIMLMSSVDKKLWWVSDVWNRKETPLISTSNAESYILHQNNKYGRSVMTISVEYFIIPCLSANVGERSKRTEFKQIICFLLTHYLN